MSNAKHVHYDLAAFERDMRANFEKSEIRTEFERHQALGNEVVIQFGVFGARMDNEGLNEREQIMASCSVIAAQVENMVAEYEGDRASLIMMVLESVAQFALRGGEVVSSTDAPLVPAGHA